MIIFMGVPGSGKSVQGKLLADHLALPWLSTGEFLRMLIAGEKRKIMLEGKLLEDQEIIGLVRKIFNLVDTTQEFVLDGFPRTVAQADWLLSQVKHGQLSISSVINLKASDAAVEKRLLNRGRLDDTKSAIDERFHEYEDSIKPILEHFRAANIAVHDIDGERPVEIVTQNILQAVQA